ncbi:MAG: sensor histidine kinase [Alkalispirochaeta sp.]
MDIPHDLLQHAIESADDAVYITDRSAVILYANEATCRITGFTREELLGARPSLFSSGLTSREYYARMWASLSEGTVWREAITNRSAAGRLYECTQSITPLKDDRGTVTGFVAIQRDMSVLSSVQYEMRRARSEVERALEEKETLLRELSHRTKNDLELLRSLLSLQGEVSTQPEVKQELAIAAERVAVMGQIYTMFQTREGTGGISLRRFLDSLAGRWRESFFPEDVRFSVDVIDDGMPQEILVAVGLITNELITNAARYIRRNRDAGVYVLEEHNDDGAPVPPAVHLSVTVPEPGTLEIAVTDNGVGFPPAVLDRTTRGPGLTMVESLAQQYNGSLTVRNLDGEGAPPQGAQAIVVLRGEW